MLGVSAKKLASCFRAIIAEHTEDTKRHWNRRDQQKEISSEEGRILGTNAAEKAVPGLQRGRSGQGPLGPTYQLGH